MTLATHPPGRTGLPHEWCPSSNYGDRAGGHKPDLLVIHYTAMESASKAVKLLCTPASEVSSHYLIGGGGGIVQMVSEEHRAWHAGVSHWQGETDINSCSIGIEISHPGPKGDMCPDFDAAQMQQVITLSQDICVRRAVRSSRVVAHSDIAPHRKQDPGERFDWRAMAKAGVGFWDDSFCQQADIDAAIKCGPMIMNIDYAALAQRAPNARMLEQLQSDLGAIGYGIRRDGLWDDDVARVIIAFQRHWLQNRVDGIADLHLVETVSAMRVALASVTS